MPLSPLRGGSLFSFFSLLIALFRCLKWGLPVYARLTLNSLYSSRQPILKILLPQPPYRTWLPTLLLFLAHLITSGNQCTPPPCFGDFVYRVKEYVFPWLGPFVRYPLLNLTYFYFMRMSVFATCLYGHHLCAWCPWKLEESFRSPRFGDWRYSCELQCSLCLTVALSLCPHHFLLKVTSILLIFLLNINVFMFGGLELESFGFGLWKSLGGLLFGFGVTLIFKRFFFNFFCLVGGRHMQTPRTVCGSWLQNKNKNV